MNIKIEEQIHQNAQYLLDNPDQGLTITLTFNREAIDSMGEIEFAQDVIESPHPGIFMLARKILKEYFRLKKEREEHSEGDMMPAEEN